MDGLKTFSMNFSELKAQIYSYLGFRGVGESKETDELILSCLSDLEKIAQFNYLYRYFEELPEFLSHPGYRELLEGTTGVILSVMTLGAEVDKYLNRLSRIDMGKAVVFDASASAYLEAKSDEFERGIGKNLTYRFCPGYGGTSIADLREIFALLRPERIGITLNESNFMLPSKSMAGVIGVGKQKQKTCEGCIILPHCKYREGGTRCYSLAKK